MKKFTLVLCIILAVTMIFTACQPNDAGQGADKPSETGAEQVEATNEPVEGTTEEPVTIVWWAEEWQEEQALIVKQAFEDKYPNITVNVELKAWEGMDQQQLIALRGNKGPDIVNQAVAWTIPFASNKLLLPLDDFIKESQVDMEDFWPGALDTCSSEGKIYGLPYRSEALALFYNKTMFEEVGLDPEKGPTTNKELMEYAEKLTIDKDGDGVTDQYGMALIGNEKNNFNHRLMPVMWTFGGDVLNEDYTECTLTSPKSIEAVEFYTGFLSKGFSPEATIANDGKAARSLFINKTAAMYVSGQYDMPTIKSEGPDVDFGVCLIPGTSEVKSAAVLGGWNVSINANTQHPEAAWKFVEFLTSTEMQKVYSVTFPGRASAMDSPRYEGEYMDVFGDQLNYARAVPAIKSWTEVSEIMLIECQEVMAGKKTVEEAMDSAKQQIDGLLE